METPKQETVTSGPQDPVSVVNGYTITQSQSCAGSDTGLVGKENWRAPFNPRAI